MKAANNDVAVYQNPVNESFARKLIGILGYTFDIIRQMAVLTIFLGSLWYAGSFYIENQALTERVALREASIAKLVVQVSELTTKNQALLAELYQERNKGCLDKAYDATKSAVSSAASAVGGAMKSVATGVGNAAVWSKEAVIGLFAEKPVTVEATVGAAVEATSEIATRSKEAVTGFLTSK